MRPTLLLFLATAATVPQAAAAAPVEEIDAFTADLVVTPATAQRATERCERAVAIGSRAIDALEARTGPATVAEDLQLRDDIYRHISAAYGEAGVWFDLHPSSEVRDAGQACRLKLSTLVSRASVSRAIYDRLAAIPADSVPADLVYPLERTLLGFRLGGVALDEERRLQLKALNEKISEVSSQFGRNIAEGDRSVKFTPAQLDGLPEDWLAAREVDEDGMITVTTAYPDTLPVMRFAHDRAVRRKMTEVFLTRAFPENGPVLEELVRLRQERAGMLGFESHAHAAMANQMIGSPERATAFLQRMRGVTAQAAQAEYDELLAFARTRDPSIETVEYWDTRYFQNLLRKERYDVDDAEVRQYFSLAHTQQGMFDLMSRMFDVRFESWDTPVWDYSVSSWEMYEGDELVGRFYLDLSPREGKFSHGAQFSVRSGVAGGDVPVKGLMTNFPATGPMPHGDVVTFLHEFGHLIQGLFADHQVMAMASRRAMPVDTIEAPSQFLEEWAWDYDTLATFARNPDGEPIPRDLVARMNEGRMFGEALRTTFGLGLSAVSMAYYDATPDEDFSDTFNKEFAKYSPVALGAGPMWASWGHLTGYSSNYYTYNWSEVIAQDLLSRFREAGLNDKATAIAYRDIVLKGGGTRSPDDMIEAFLGRPLSYEAIEAYLRGEGAQ